MGSLWGHLDEGLAFFILSMWWIFNLFDDYVKCGGSTAKVKAPISYDCCIRGKRIPIEIYWKLFISVGGFLIELFEDTPYFIDEEGRFRNVAGLQHMSIFALFFLHALLDCLRYYNFLYIDGLEYLTFAMSYFWYGAIFFFHTKSDESDPLKDMVHLLAILWCLGIAFSLIWEYRSDNKFLPHYFRALLVLCLGTWFIHTPFLLFSTDSFPGENPNPRWDRFDPMNAQVMATLFGAHLFVNTSFTVVIYTILKCRSSGTFIRMNNMFEMDLSPKRYQTVKQTDEKFSLLEGGEEEEEENEI